MKKNVILQLLSLAIPLFALLSCVDHLSPEPPLDRLRIKSITQVLPDNNGVTNITEFTYNQSNQLSFLLTYDTPDSTATLTSKSYFTYNMGELTQLSRIRRDKSSEKYLYTYNPGGQPTTLQYTGNVNDVYNVSFQYNGNQLASSKRKFIFSSVSYEKDITYNFSGVNLGSVDSKTTFTKNVETVTNSTSTFTYDDKINPFWGLPVIPAPGGFAKPSTGNFSYYTYFGGFDNVLNLSKNNVLSETRTDLSETTYEYVYNSDGLPTSRITKKKNTPQDNGNVEETLTFVYESY